MSWAELSSVLSLGGGWVKVEIEAISAQPTEFELDLAGLSLAKKDLMFTVKVLTRPSSFKFSLYANKTLDLTPSFHRIMCGSSG